MTLASIHPHNQEKGGSQVRRLGPYQITALLIALSGCTNGGMSTSMTTSLLASSASTAQTTYLISIASVLRDTLDPTGTFDVLGDGTGSIGTNCTGADPNNPNQGPSTCNCVYSYVNPSTGATESQEVATVYQEANLVRCLHTTIPAAVTNTSVELHITSNNQYSNQVVFAFGTASSGFDTSVIRSYAQTKRYTCRDILSVPSIISSTSDFVAPMYDPNQSEDPLNSYPINFYTSNVGMSILSYGGGIAGVPATTSYDCPPNLLKAPPSYSSMIYSTAPLQTCPAGSTTAPNCAPAGTSAKVISPRPGPAVAGGPRPFDRETFYLSQFASGVWQIPVNGIVAPGVASQSPDGTGHSVGGPAPLGFGASPISSGQSGIETCPDTTATIPKGYHWVKLWLFRMGLPPRQTIAGNKLVLLGDISCNPSPGVWPDNPAPAAPFNSVFPACPRRPSIGHQGAFPLVARVSGVAGTGMCWNVDAGGSAAVNYFSTYGAAAGSDTWQPVQSATPSLWSCGGTNASDPANTCSSFTASGGNTGLPYDATPSPRR